MPDSAPVSPTPETVEVSGMGNPDTVPTSTWQPASARYVKARILTAVIVCPVPIAVGIYLATQYSAWWWFLAGPFVLGLLNTLLFSTRHVRSLAHAELDDAILVREGRLSRSTTLIPYGRLQHVTIAEGAIDSRFGLAKVAIHTAASGGSTDIPGLEAEAARALRARLVERSRSRDDGL